MLFRSLEENIETIKKYQDNVDILCCDKSLKPLLDNGITPTYCLVCDANVSYETYMKPVEDKLQDITLFSNVCANPKWTKNGNWKDVYFFVNEDILKSEIEFSGLSGCRNIIPAGTNVSNAMIVFLTQSNNNGRNNFFGYDKILMIGFDYSWDDDKYYAFNSTGDGKQNYMKQVYLYNLGGKLCYTSTNLLFSAKWMDKFIHTFKQNVYQCSKRSILAGMGYKDLEEQLKYRYKPEDSNKVRSLVEYKRELLAKINQIDHDVFVVGRDHYKSVVRTT